MPGLYDSRSLTTGINQVKVPNPFVLNSIFKTKEQHSSDKIDIEITSGSEKLAQFVGTNDPTPRNVKKLTKKVVTVTLPRTFESKIFTAQELMDYNAIGNLYDDKAKAQAQAERITVNLSELKDRITRRREQMAIEALSTGKIIVSQSNIAFDYDFGFVNNKQLFTHTGAKLWTAADSDISAQLLTWRRSMMRDSGLNADILLLGSAAAEAALSNVKLRAALDANNNKVGQLDLTQKLAPGALFLGRINGVDLYEYNQQYLDESGTATDMLATDRAVLVASDGPFRVHLGAAYRIANQKASAIMGEYLLEVDSRSNEQMLQWNCEQKSLPTIHDPSCVISAKVV